MTDQEENLSGTPETADLGEANWPAETHIETEGGAEKEPEPMAPAEKKAPKPEPTPVKKLVILPAPKKIPLTHDPLTVKIEKVLEEGLEDAYQKLSPVAKQEFKIKGETAAVAIKELLFTTKVQVKKILNLIITWLKMLPGVNRFFLEQEAKIKTDKLLLIKKQEEEKIAQKII